VFQTVELSFAGAIRTPLEIDVAAPDAERVTVGVSGDAVRLAATEGMPARIPWASVRLFS
jgi:hypothetical protein